MTKQEQFLYVVQTAILANANNIASFNQSDPTYVDRYRHEISASGIIGIMHDVLWASERIPADMGPVEAANEFVSFMLDNLRHIEEGSGSRFASPPKWFAR